MAELFTVTGLTEVHQRLQALSAEVPFLMAIALKQEGDALAEVSQSLTPVETGALQASIHADEPQLAGAVAWITISAGGPGEGFERVPSNYAIRVHEDTTMRHPRGGQSHFLSQPLFAATEDILKSLADALRVAL